MPLTAPAPRGTETQKPRRLARMVISGPLLLSLFQKGVQPGNWVSRNPLPHDAKLVRVQLTVSMDLELIIESDAFREVDGQLVESLPDVQFTMFRGSLDELRTEHPELFPEVVEVCFGGLNVEEWV